MDPEAQARDKENFPKSTACQIGKKLSYPSAKKILEILPF